MKSVIFFFLVTLVIYAVGEEFYTNKFDAIDVDNILENPRLFTFYENCVLETGKCNEEGNVLKSVIPEALVTDCKKCSEHQRKSVEKVITTLIKKHPESWKRLIAKYDPTGEHQKQYKHYLDQIQ